MRQVWQAALRQAAHGCRRTSAPSRLGADVEGIDLINAALPKEKWCYNMKRTDKLSAVQAVFRAGSDQHVVPVKEELQEAEFTIELPAGNTALQGWFVDQDQQEWFGPYLHIQRLSGDTD